MKPDYDIQLVKAVKQSICPGCYGDLILTDIEQEHKVCLQCRSMYTLNTKDEWTNWVFTGTMGHLLIMLETKAYGS